MNSIPALPPELYEVINAGLAACDFVAWVICLRYLLTEYLAGQHLRTYKLAIGFTVFLTGEWPRMTWAWLARDLTNSGHDPTWMGTLPWVFVPVGFSLICILGMSCIVKSLVPYVWGRWGYALSFGAAVLAIAASVLLRG
jgi:hypothetical protein